MHKITKKLFRYFTCLLLFFAVIAFIGFGGVFRYSTSHYHEKELKARAETIKNQLEQFINVPGEGHRQGRGMGRGAYLRFINDIAMADVYIIDQDGTPFAYGSHGTAGNTPTPEVLAFAPRIFSSGSYAYEKKQSPEGDSVLYAGIPLLQNGRAVYAVIIRDTAKMDHDSLVLAVSILGVCLLLALFFSGILSFFLSKRFIRPIRQIAAATKELTGGNYLARTNVHDNTELGELALETDLLAKKLEDARQESRKLEQMQKNYISNISHELRTPVAAIRSSLEALCDGVVTGEKAAAYERQMLTECICLQRLVNDMLELSRLQNNDFPIEKETMDLLRALEDALRTIRAIARPKHVAIQSDEILEEWPVIGDYGRLRQMFLTALDNAVKYSPEGAAVLVSARQNPDAYSICITDHGCGIPKEDLANIFTRFYRSSQASAKGSGLGLAILKSIADRHDITVELQSAPQEGTTVVFHIPKTLRNTL